MLHQSIANQKAKAKTTNKTTNANIEAMGQLLKSNKIAIQNLKQVINSTGKKILAKKR